MEEKKKVLTRFVGIDLGKRTYELAIVGKGGKVTMSNGKTFEAGRQSLYKKLRVTDIVGLEAGNMAFIMAKELAACVGCQVYVLNASHLPLIYGSMKKTDKEDALKLAHIIEYLPKEQLPVVPLPSEKEIRRRKILAYYRRTQQSRSRAINQLHGLFMSAGITTMKRSDFSTAENRLEAIQSLAGIEREEAEYLVTCLEHYEQRIKTLHLKIKEESAGDEEIQRLQSIPGIGPITAFAFVSHVAQERFENSGQVSNYLGLVPRVYISGDTKKYGQITKRGNSYIRALLVQASWSLVLAKKDNTLKARYNYMTLEKSISKKKAIVAVARRLGELMYTLMRDGTWYMPKPFIVKMSKGEDLAQLALSA